MRGGLSLRLALLSCYPLLLALVPQEEALREAAPPDPALLPLPPAPPLRRLEEPAPIVLKAPPAPPDELGYYYHVDSAHRGKRRRRWPEEPAGVTGKSQRQRRRDVRRTGRS